MEETKEKTAILKAIKDKADVRNTRLDHAVDFLNNHIPCFGDENWDPNKDEGEEWKRKIARIRIDYLPTELKTALTESLIAAANYAKKCFEES